MKVLKAEVIRYPLFVYFLFDYIVHPVTLIYLIFFYFFRLSTFDNIIFIFLICIEPSIQFEIIYEWRNEFVTISETIYETYLQGTRYNKSM